MQADYIPIPNVGLWPFPADGAVEPMLPNLAAKLVDRAARTGEAFSE